MNPNETLAQRTLGFAALTANLHWGRSRKMQLGAGVMSHGQGVDSPERGRYLNKSEGENYE